MVLPKREMVGLTTPADNHHDITEGDDLTAGFSVCDAYCDQDAVRQFACNNERRFSYVFPDAPGDRLVVPGR